MPRQHSSLLIFIVHPGNTNKCLMYKISQKQQQLLTLSMGRTMELMSMLMSEPSILTLDGSVILPCSESCVVVCCDNVSGSSAASDQTKAVRVTCSRQCTGLSLSCQHHTTTFLLSVSVSPLVLLSIDHQENSEDVGTLQDWHHADIQETPVCSV